MAEAELLGCVGEKAPLLVALTSPSGPALSPALSHGSPPGDQANRLLRLPSTRAMGRAGDKRPPSKGELKELLPGVLCPRPPHSPPRAL